MGRIQTGIGLITGIPIADTVDQLIQLSARRRDMLIERTDKLKEEQIAVTELSAMLYSVQYTTDNLGKEDLFDRRAATSSNENILSATVTGSPPLGTYQFTPLRIVQSQQLLSSGFASDSDPIGAGELTFRFGAHVERSVDLRLLNGGEGVRRGKIRITDRSGTSAEIDLSTVQTVDDVLEAINANTTINVMAVARGDHFRLVDNTGLAICNLKVQEVGNGSTAASLGLGEIDAAAFVADGQDVLWLSDRIRLDKLNDGNGVRITPILPDISYRLRDGTQGDIDFWAIQEGSSQRNDETTLGELLELINSAEPGKLRAEIGPDGDRLVITDLTEGEETFQLSSLIESEAAEDLGINGQSTDGVIVGRRILGGLKTVLLSSLDGGQGLGQLGTLELTDRSGASDTVDLSNAETLQDVINTINAADVEITARANHARNGLELIDSTGMLASNLIVANGDSETATAEKLGLAADVSIASVESGDMHLQVIAYNTRLDDLNGGAGVANGTFTIIDSTGREGRIDLADMETVGDLLREIGRLPNICATINQTGDGILIEDIAHGEGTLEIREGNSITAEDLHLLRDAVEVDDDGETTQLIDGSMTLKIQIEEDDSLADLVRAINDLDAGVRAMMFLDGSDEPHRLALMSEQAGKMGELVVDSSKANFAFEETARAQDSLLVFGQPSAAAAGVLVSGRTNSFTRVVSGLTLEINQASSSPVMITVARTDVDLIATVQAMVDNYNGFRERLDELTAYDVETNTRSVLTGDAAALRMEMEFTNLLARRFIGAGPIQRLAEIGIEMNSDGTLTFTDSELKARFAENHEAVESFFAGLEANNPPTEFGIYIRGRTVQIDHERLNEKYAEDPEAVLNFFGRVRDRYRLADLGISFSENGIEVDESLFQAKLAADSQLARKLTSGEGGGLSGKFAALIESIAGEDTSVLAHRFKTLKATIEQNEDRITLMYEQLEIERERLLMQFYRMEIAIGKLQSNLNALEAITVIAPIGSSDRSR